MLLINDNFCAPCSAQEASLMRRDISEVMTVLQEHQAVLQTILAQLEKTTARQDKLDEMLSSLQEEIQSSRETEQCTPTGKRKSRVARDLTVSYCSNTYHRRRKFLV